MYIGILDEQRIKNYCPKGKNPILIRIFNPNNNIEKNDLKYINYYKDILELQIKDITIIDNIKFEEEFKLLNDFILKNNFDEIIIHCSLGLSRSPAIMICVAKILNNPKLIEEIKTKFQFYNKYIVDQFNNFKYIKKENCSKEFIFEESKNYSKKKIKTKDNFIIID